jgi:hypothetical protein
MTTSTDVVRTGRWTRAGRSSRSAATFVGTVYCYGRTRP